MLVLAIIQMKSSQINCITVCPLIMTGYLMSFTSPICEWCCCKRRHDRKSFQVITSTCNKCSIKQSSLNILFEYTFSLFTWIHLWTVSFTSRKKNVSKRSTQKACSVCWLWPWSNALKDKWNKKTDTKEIFWDKEIWKWFSF